MSVGPHGMCAMHTLGCFCQEGPNHKDSKYSKYCLGVLWPMGVEALQQVVLSPWWEMPPCNLARIVGGCVGDGVGCFGAIGWERLAPHIVTHSGEGCMSTRI